MDYLLDSIQPATPADAETIDRIMQFTTQNMQSRDWFYDDDIDFIRRHINSESGYTLKYVVDGQIAGFLNGRAGGDADIDTHLIGDDAGQGGLAEAGRAVEQGVVQGFVSQPGGFDIDEQVALCLLLTGVIVQQLGPQADLPGVLGSKGGGDDGGGI